MILYDKYRLTCSIGIAENNATNNFNNDEVLKRTDRVYIKRKVEEKIILNFGADSKSRLNYELINSCEN